MRSHRPGAQPSDAHEGGVGASLEELVDSIHLRLLESTVPVTTGIVTELARGADPLLGREHLQWVVDAVLARTLGLGPLDPVLADDAVSDVLVNSDGHVFVERDGRLCRLSLVLTRAEVELLIERVVSPLGLRADRSSPMVDARLPDGSRVNAVVPPLAVDGPCLAIRRFCVSGRPIGQFCSAGVEALLRWAVEARLNIVVVGGTGAGKTTLLNAIAGALAAGERLITIEDTAELRLAHDHVIRLEARPANPDGVGETTIRDLVRNALRMRPDRIIVGEVRGPEALDMLQAMNTGHEGSLSTCHANSAEDALRRLETMVLLGGVALPVEAIRDQIAASIDLLVFVERLRGGARSIRTVHEVTGIAGGRVETRALTRSGRLGALPKRDARAAGVASPSDGWLEER